MFGKRDFPRDWKEDKKFRSIGKRYEKRIKVTYGDDTLVLEANDSGRCNKCNSKCFQFSTRRLSPGNYLGYIVDNSGQTYCLNCKSGMLPKEYEKFILTGEYKRHM